MDIFPLDLLVPFLETPHGFEQQGAMSLAGAGLDQAVEILIDLPEQCLAEARQCIQQYFLASFDYVPVRTPSDGDCGYLVPRIRKGVES
jgi:hypothetical protein